MSSVFDRYLRGSLRNVVCCSWIDSRENDPSCTRCHNSFPAGSRITEFDGKQYHPDCFSCADCNKAITSQFYPFNSGYLCSACHETRFPRKRCGKCGSVITSAGITFAGASYHAACFLCVTCKQPISAQSKISMVDGQPCCVNCYEEKHAKRCSRCQKAIVADVEYLEFEDKYWHKECFTCSKCQKCIAEESFYQDGNLILCKDCI